MLFSIHTTARNRSLRGQQFLRRKFSNQNPKPRRTHQNSQTRRRSHPEKTKEKNEQHFVLFSSHTKAKNRTLRGQQFIRQKSFEQHPKPRRTLQNHHSRRQEHPEKTKRKNGQHFVLFSPGKVPKQEPNRSTPKNPFHHPI